MKNHKPTILKISFERKSEYMWIRREDDPHDSRYETVDILRNKETVFSQIEKLKARGWKIQPVDPSFDGFILIRKV